MLKSAVLGATLILAASTAQAQNSLNFELYRSFTTATDGQPFSDPICSGTVTLSEHRFAYSDTYNWAPWQSWSSICGAIAGYGNDQFGARFWGQVVAPYASSWYFDLMSNDGSSVRVNGSQVLSLPGEGDDRSMHTWVSLAAGANSYEVSYFSLDGSSQLYAGWDPTLSTIATPEPATLTLLTTGLLSLGARRFRRRRKTD